MATRAEMARKRRKLWALMLMKKRRRVLSQIPPLLSTDYNAVMREDSSYQLREDGSRILREV